MPWIGAAITVGGSLLGNMMSSNASSDAANSINAGTAQAGAIQEDIFNRQSALEQPFIDAGKTALPALQAGVQPGGQFNKQYTLADFQSGPQSGLYDFAKGQSMEAMQNQLNASGLGGSTNAVVGAGQLAGNLANQYFNTGFNQNMQQNQSTLGALEGVAGMGQSAASLQSANLGNLGQSLGNMALTGANANAASQVSQGNMWNSSLSGLGNSVGQMYALQSIFGGGGGGFGGGGSVGGGSSGGMNNAAGDLPIFA